MLTANHFAMEGECSKSLTTLSAVWSLASDNVQVPQGSDRYTGQRHTVTHRVAGIRADRFDAGPTRRPVSRFREGRHDALTEQLHRLDIVHIGHGEGDIRRAHGGVRAEPLNHLVRSARDPTEFGESLASERARPRPGR